MGNDFAVSPHAKVSESLIYSARYFKVLQMDFFDSKERQANFIRRLPAAILGGVVVHEIAHNLGANYPLAEIIEFGGAILGAALQDKAQSVANRINPPKN
jgi:hypothetical protein